MSPTSTPPGHRWRPRTPKVLAVATAFAVAVGGVAVANSTLSDLDYDGSGNTVTDGTSPDSPSLSLGAHWWPYSAGPGRLGAIPQSLAVDHVVDGQRMKKVFTTVTRNEDSSGAQLRNTMRVSNDNGLEYHDYSALPDGFNWASSGRTSDGKVKVLKFTMVPAAAPNRFALPVATSADLGKTWSVTNAPLTENKWKMGWYRLTHGLVELGDGTLLQPVYAGDAVGAAKGQFVVILQSTDGGASWSQRSLLNTDGDANEVAISRTTDGRLVVIARGRDLPGAEARPMRQTFSDDDGLTWAPMREFVPPPGLPKVGILPELALQTNGALVLTYGRPDNNVVVSWDGTGKTWDAGKVVYSNHIRETHRGRSMGSSGNTSIVPVESNYSLNFGDICHNIWSCREHGHQNGAWARRIDAVTSGKGKIDLATGVKNGTMKLGGSVVPADARFAEQRLEGAVDGSNELRAAARLAAAAPKQITLELDRDYTLDRIGLMLDRGRANSAKVQVSLDGKEWSQPLVRQRDSVDYALRYTEIEPVRARYVRVSNDGNTPFTALTELELYAANTWTFENDAVNVTPRGTTDTLHAFTADTLAPAQNSSRRAILVDMDPETRGTMTFPMTPRPGVRMNFGYAAAGYGSGAIWEVLGTDSSGESTVPWKFHFRPAPAGAGFALSAWDGSAWQAVGTFPTFTPNNQWIPVEFSADTRQATMTVHGRTLTTAVRAGTATSLTGFRPSTGLNVADQNMEHSFDNVEITALAPYTVSAADPESLVSLPERTVSTTVSVHNFTDTALSLPVSVSPLEGYTVEAPSSVTVAPGSRSDVKVDLTRTGSDTTARTLEIRVGDALRTVGVQAHSDWLRVARMTASSTSAASSAENLNDGRTDTTTWGSGGAGAWNDGTASTWPDWVQATWSESVPLSKVVVYTIDRLPNEPATKYGVRDFDVQAQSADGSWATVAEVRGNTAGVITTTFPRTETKAMRILIHDSNDHAWSRLISVQGFSD